MCLWQVSLTDDSGARLGHLVVTSGGDLNCDDVNLNRDYFATVHWV